MTAVTRRAGRDDSVRMDDMARLFTRFREHADVDALGAVFDGTAGRLLSLALQLCGSPADAEDALQATFVRAMQKAHEFDAQKPLLPWLCGILAGEAHNLRRREARRRAGTLPELPAGDGGPVAASENRELVATLRTQVEQLPTEQRQVLLLQLQHGLTPAEIAEVLGVAPGTVRMRIHRGLAALRRLLPASLAALLISALPARGLAAVRTAVLQQAVVGLPLVVVAGGILAMKKVALVVAVLLFCAVGGFVSAPLWRGEAGPAPMDHGQPSSAAAPTAGSLEVGRADRLASERVEILPSSASEPASPADGTGSLRVRVVRSDNGAAVEHATVAVWPWRGDVDESAEARRGSTGVDGSLQIDRLERGGFVLKVDGVEASRVQVEAGAVLEQVVEVPPGVPVRGRVLHADGRAATGASIVLGNLTVPAIPVATADANGGFALPDVWRHHKVGAVLADYPPSLLQALEPERAIEVVLPDPAAVIAGLVVDHAGAPIAGARVTLYHRQRALQWMDAGGFQCEVASPQWASTDAEGGFHFEAEAGRTWLKVLAPRFAPHEQAIEASGRAAAELRIRLDRGQQVKGRIVDQHGVGVADARVFLGGSYGVLRKTGPDGAFGYASAAAGRVVVRVEGDDIEPQQGECDAAAEPSEWTIAVERRPDLRLRLVDQNGGALAGWHVRVTSLLEVVRSTQADGRVTLHAPSADRGRLQLETPSGPCLVVDWPAGMSAGCESELVVPAGLLPNGVITGRVVDADGKPVAEGWVELRRSDDVWFDHPGVLIVDGRFRAGPIAGGDYELSVRRREHRVGGEPVLVAGLGSAEARDVGDLRLPAEGQLAFRLLRRGGEPLRQPLVFVFDSAGREGIAPSTDGTLQPFPVGRYRYRVMAEETLWVRGEFEVRAGAPTVVELVLEPAVRRKIRFPVPTPDWGAPIRVCYTLHAPDGSVYEERDFDPREELPISIVPTVVPGTWRLQLVLDDGRRFAGEFAVEDLQPRAAPIEIAVQPSR